MTNLHKKYCVEVYDDNHELIDFNVQNTKGFNFAYDVVDVIAAAEPERRAMVWCDVAGNERSFTFGEISKLSNQAANFFLEQGITKGDAVMLVLKRHYEYWYAILALHKIGAIAIPATHLLTIKDIVYRVKSANIKAVVATNQDTVANFTLEAAKECPELQKLFIVREDRPGFINFSAEIEKQSTSLTRIPNDEKDPLLLYFTSGTTGYPKMVIQDQTYPIAHILTAKHWHNVNPDGLHLTVADTGWAKAAWGKIYGQWFLAAGIFVYDYDKFIPHDMLAVIEKYQLTTFCAPPTIYRFFIKEGMGDYDLSSLEYVTTAGEALNHVINLQFQEKTGLAIMEGFGQTETTLAIANLVGSKAKPGSMGRPVPLYDIMVVDENLKQAASNQIGEIVLIPKKGQVGIFSGYLRDPELEEFAWRGGVYHTGDTAYVDEDGYYWYVGRTDDLIKSSGYRIGPFEVESVLMEHNAVLECAITGVPDEIRGQLVKATVVLTSAYHPSEELKKELQEYVKKNTAPYKYPRIIEFVEDIPKTISGKIRRVEIREKDTRDTTKN